MKVKSQLESNYSRPKMEERDDAIHNHVEDLKKSLRMRRPE